MAQGVKSNFEDRQGFERSLNYQFPQAIWTGALRMSRLLKVLLSIAIAYAVWFYVLKPNHSAQDFTSVQSGHDAVQLNGFQITRLEPYAGTFRVLSRENYHIGDTAKISPVDFALGWGAMADPNVYKHISIRQSNRWYYWRYENTPPIPHREIETQSANTHLIPATELIAKQLSDIDQDNLIQLKGYLVEVTGENGFVWRSSLTREDTGNGACELMLVEEVSVISKR